MSETLAESKQSEIVHDMYASDSIILMESENVELIRSIQKKEKISPSKAVKKISPSKVVKKKSKNRDFTNEKKKRLTKMVEDLPLIWDLNNKLHSNSFAVSPAWKKIATSFTNCTGKIFFRLLF